MLKTYGLSVPCKSYIRKYITALYGDSIELDHRSEFGITILTMLSAKPLAQANKTVLNLAFRDNNAEIRFSLPMDYFYRVDKDLSEQQVYNINRYLDRVFQSDLFVIVNVAAAFGLERRTAIEAFARKYDIVLEEDISYEALKKAEDRFRKSPTSKNNFLLQMSSANKVKLRA